MEWLTNNPLANMHGPDFLFLYAVTIVVAILFGRRAIRNADPTSDEPPPPPPLRPDPFEVAYLRGGEAEVVRFTVFRLIQNGLLMLNDARSRTIVRVKDPARAATLTEIERSVYQSLHTPMTMKDVVNGVAPDFGRFCMPLEASLLRLGLLATQAMCEAAARVRWSLLTLIFGLGFYKFAVALSRGRTNVEFLLIMAVIATILAFKMFKTPRLSKRGREYLKRLQAQMRPVSDESSPDFDGGDLAFQVALLGSVALAGTMYAEYAEALRPPQSSFGDSTGGCGGGSSSDGGCGGGGSDGGGGGGGCGGCGGGGD